ncbi:ribonuclease P protein component [Nitrosophilus kaiyonis]|uniref:ribonuclease P protein component n=1 Tax=Nitrosophilus kaiyonis TaxID=2930200 RepID=UPI0031E8601B
MGSLKNFITLKSSKEFNYIYKNSKAVHSQYFVIFYKKTRDKKVGFVSSKKIGNAVKRNRAKRRLRALFLLYSDKIPTGTYIFVAKKDILDADFKKLKKVFEKLIFKVTK